MAMSVAFRTNSMTRTMRFRAFSRTIKVWPQVTFRAICKDLDALMGESSIKKSIVEPRTRYRKEELDCYLEERLSSNPKTEARAQPDEAKCCT